MSRASLHSTLFCLAWLVGTTLAAIGPPSKAHFKLIVAYSPLGAVSLKQDDERVLSRHRRFLIPSGSGWVITASFALAIPLDSSLTGTLTLTSPFTYTVDTGTVTGGRRMGRWPRSVGDENAAEHKLLLREQQRLSLIGGLEDWMSQLEGVGKLGGEGQRLDTHACALRVVCEVAMVSTANMGIPSRISDAISPLQRFPAVKA